MANSVFNLSDLNGSNGFKINGIAAGDNSGISVSSAGDVNGDGFDDLIIGAPGADPNVSSSGQSYVVFGKSGGFTSSLNLSDLNGSNGFKINGIATADFSGSSVSSAGDVNGDGFDDLIIGADRADPNGNQSGQSYVVFGKSGGFTSFLNLSDLNGSNGFKINGIAAGDNSGRSVSSAGDVNGDGVDDLIIGASGANQSYVVFGKSGGFTSILNLSDLNGTNGFQINGIATGDFSGSSVSSAGDVNGDGVDDLIIGASGANQSYVVFGKKSGGFTSILNLSDLNGTNGFQINGIATGDFSGSSVSSAGDVNGDGFDDLIIGAPGANQSYVVFGKSGGFTSILNLSDLNGTNGFQINGITAFDLSGVSVSSVGDINGDGFDDLIIGARGASPNGSASGQSYVIFGKSGGFTSAINLSDLDGTNGFKINGIAAFDNSGTVSSAGDVNGDGFDDLIIGAFTADPNGSDSGQSYVVFGNAAPELDLNSGNRLVNGFKINGITAGDKSGRSVSSAGDVNGDGFDDLIIGAPGANQSYVVFGKSGGFTSSLNLSDLNGSNGFKIHGIAPGGTSGWSVSSAGDVNGDGFDDLIIGTFQTGSNGSDPGQSYVVFGKSGGFTSSLNLSDLNGSNGFKINGIAPGDTSGSSVSSAGDVNGDGFDDLIIGAYRADPNGSYSGQSYVVFGKSGGFTSSLNLSDLNGTNGFKINGIAASDLSGFSVSSVGDVNGDGFDDLIIGAYRADPNGINAGQSYVVFGKGGGFASTLNLSDLNGSNGFKINGITTSDHSGFSVSGAGDVNGDGFDDLIIGAHWADPNGSRSGQSYVVFGQSGGFASSLNLSDLNGSNGFKLNGIATDDYSGWSVSGAGDINGDGFDDLIIGAYKADPNGSSSGQSYVVFGQSGGFTSTLNLSDLNGSNGFKINGITAGDSSGRSVSNAGDVNGDGFDDLIIGAYNADPNGSSSGQSYVVFGNAGIGAGGSIELSRLGGSAVAGIDFNATFTGSPVSIVSSNLSLVDRNSPTLAKATITIANPLNGFQEFVFADTTGTAITSGYNFTTGTLSLSGIDTVANYQKVLRTVQYFNTAANPNITTRTIEFVVDDGQAHSNTSTVATTTLSFPPPVPPTITGISQDTGVSNSDGITKINNPIFSGTAEANSTVQVIIGGSPVGTTTASASGNWSFGLPSALVLKEGNYAVIAISKSAVSNIFSLTIDTTAPILTLPSDITVETGSPTDTSATGVATATDNLDLNVNITFSDSTVSSTITRTWVATDDAGNVSSANQIITIKPPTTINGTNNSEVIVATNTPNIIDGKAGNDVIYGYQGDGVSGVGSTAKVPTLNPASGGVNDRDIIRGAAGNDTLYGGGGNDTFLVSGIGDGFDIIFGDDGYDTVVAETAGTVIGVIGYNNGVEEFVGHNSGDTIVKDFTSGNILNFSNTTLTNIAEVNANGGNDTVIASNLSNIKIRGGAGNDNLTAGSQTVTFVYDNTNNGFDTFTNGTGTSIAQAETAGTVIGVIGYQNGVEEFVGHNSGDTIIQDFTSGNILNFSNTTLTNIAEVNANGGNDTVIASNLSSMKIRGGAGNDNFTAGSQTVTFVYDSTNNGFDTFTNGTGTSIAQAETAGTVIGVIGYQNGVEEFIGHSSGDTIIKDSTGNNTLNFSNTTLTNIAEVDASSGNDTVIASNLSNMKIRGGAGNDILNAGAVNVTWLYNGTTNGFDTLNNGSGISTILVEADSTIISLVSGFANGVDQIDVNSKTNVKVVGTAGNDTLNFSNVAVINNPGDFEINGGNGNDTIIATSGNDRIVGGAGKDTLTGGSGVDNFVFNAQSDSRFNYGDIIADFDATNGERIILNAITGGIGSFNAGGAFSVGGVTNEAILLGNQLRVDLNANAVFDTSDLEINFTAITGAFSAANLVF
jgi:Ca2+-binding RTX toxin-like protein